MESRFTEARCQDPHYNSAGHARSVGALLTYLPGVVESLKSTNSWSA